MALRVWLPLNKDFRNQGLDDITVTTASTSIKTDGPVGGCCQVTNTQRITFPSQEWMRPTNEQSFSIAMFVRATTFNYIIAAGAFEIRLIESTAQFRTGDGSGGYTCNAQDNVTKSLGVWYHLTGVWDSLARKVSLYVDGNLAASANSTVSTFKAISSTINVVYGGQFDICDFRMYDHALSAKEAREISKALVLHYKLDDEFIGTITNLVPVGNYGTTTGSTWGRMYTVNTVVEADDSVPFSTCNKIEMTRLDTGSGGGYGVSRATYIPINPDGVYTYSMYVKPSDDFVYSHANFLYRREYDSGNTQVLETGINTAAKREYLGDGWYRIWNTFTANSATTKVTVQFFTYPDKDIVYYIGGTQLEAGSILHPYVEGTETHADVIDCSGYGNNGLAIGNPTRYDSTPKYRCSTYFGTGQYIRAYRNAMIRDEITVAIWGYMSTWSYNARMISCTETGGWNFEPHTATTNGRMEFLAYSSGDTARAYARAVDTIKVSALSSGWHHFAGTYSKYDDKICYYRDGELIASAATTSGQSIGYHASNSLLIAAEPAGGQVPAGTPRYLNGALSDVRVYGTALAPEDIAELYHTKASIDNHGNFYCGELKEV